MQRGYGGAYGGVWRSLRLAGVWGLAVGFVAVRLAGSLFSRCKYVFIFDRLFLINVINFVISM
jgi:hypothetical protein